MNQSTFTYAANAATHAQISDMLLTFCSRDAAEILIEQVSCTDRSWLRSPVATKVC